MRIINSVLGIIVASSMAANAAVNHTVTGTDTLWSLAAHYYKDPFKWQKIADANPAPKINDPHWIYPGQVIVIPDLDADEADEPAVKRRAKPEVVEAPEEEPQPEAPAEQASKPEPEIFTPADIGVPLGDSLSKNMPEGLVTGGPSLKRIKVSKEWKADGVIIDQDEMLGAVTAGDPVDVKIDDIQVQRGAKFSVYRKSSPSDEDDDDESKYLTRVGVLEIRRPLKGRVYRALITSSPDSIEAGDLLRKED